MFITVLGQKEASPRAMEHRRSLSFVLTFFPDLKRIGVPEYRYEGRLTGKGTLGRKTTVCRDALSFTQAHYTVLYNSTVVAPYIEKHKNILRDENPGEPIISRGDFRQLVTDTYHE